MNYIFNFIVCFVKKVPAYNPFLGQRHLSAKMSQYLNPSRQGDFRPTGINLGVANQTPFFFHPY